MASEPRDQWEPLVGRLILTCGDIELRLLQLHWNLSIGGSYNENLKNLGMGEKAKEILGQVQMKDLRPTQKKNIARVLSDTIKLAHSRNLVAHNPLYMDIYANAEGNFLLVPSIRSLRDSNKHIPLEGLALLVEEAKRIEAELSTTVIDLT